MQRLEVSGAVRPIYGSLGLKRLRTHGDILSWFCMFWWRRTLPPFQPRFS